MAEDDPDRYPTAEEEYSQYAYYEDEARPGADDDDIAEEWQPGKGQCDNCDGPPRTDAEKLAVLGSSIVPVCACWSGQGAAPEDCTCGGSR